MFHDSHTICFICSVNVNLIPISKEIKHEGNGVDRKEMEGRERGREVRNAMIEIKSNKEEDSVWHTWV